MNLARLDGATKRVESADDGRAAVAVACAAYEAARAGKTVQVQPAAVEAA